MKQLITFLFIGISITLFSQQTQYNTQKEYAAEGYDVVSYFMNKKPVIGNKKTQTTFDGAKFKFSSAKNLALFIANPTKYIPQYGGYCAYAMGAKGTKVSIDPKTFEIRDGKLYFFYNSWGTNTLELWRKEGASELQLKADKNWNTILNKK
jgi:YHS domain-containing protein